MDGWNPGEIGRLGPRRPFAVGMLLLYADLLINGAKTVRVGGKRARLGSALRCLAGGLSRRGKNVVGRRGDFGARNLLMNALQHDQDFFHSALHPAGRNINLLE